MAVWIDFSVGIHLARRSVIGLGPIMASFSWGPSLATHRHPHQVPFVSGECRLFGSVGKAGGVRFFRVGEGFGEGSGEGDIGRWRTSLLTEEAIDV